MLTGKIDLIKEKIKEDPKSYYEMRLRYHEGLLENLKFQVVEGVNDPNLDKSVRRVTRKIKYYKSKLNENN